MEQNHRVTIDIIAEQAGLHRVTVARILSGTYQGKRGTSERVLQIAHDLDYSPDMIARAMRSRRLPMVLVSGAADPYTRLHLEYLFCELRAPGLSLMVDFDRANFVEHRKQFRPVASIFFAGARIPEHESLYQSGDAIAILYAPQPELPARCFSVRVNFRPGFEEIARRLIEWGHRRIVFIDGDDSPLIVSERWAGFEQAATGTGVQVERHYVDRTPACEKLIGELFARSNRAYGCSSVLPTDSPFACSVAVNRRGLRIPQDVSLTGCDGLSFGGEQPVLSSVSVPHRHVAAVVSKIISHEILPACQRGEVIEGKRQTIPCNFWDSGTAGPAPR